jgi:arylsulfatase I/J
MLSGAADHFTNKRACGGATYVDLWKNNQPAHSFNGSYSEFTYVSHMVDVIENHNTQQPLFLFMAFQNVHGPTQAPDRFLQLYDDSIFKARRNGLAQISAVDEGIANITAALKLKGMWENTLLVFSSDNGGPADHENNFPLRGSKGSDFEGGVRVVSFVSGGWLPKDMRGKTINGMMHIADWYATFADLAGVDPTDEQAAEVGLPAIDSLSMLKLLTGANSTSPRSELPLSYTDSSAGIISGKYKFIVKDKPITNGFFPGKTTPNGTAYGSKTDCSTGCLFDLENDEVEHQDLASTKPKLVATLQKRLEQIGQTVYQSPGAGPQEDAKTMADAYGGFWGPWEGLVPRRDSFFLDGDVTWTKQRSIII